MQLLYRLFQRRLSDRGHRCDNRQGGKRLIPSASDHNKAETEGIMKKDTFSAGTATDDVHGIPAEK